MELEDKKEGLANEMQAILDKAKTEQRSFTAEEDTKLKAYKTEIKDLNPMPDLSPCFLLHCVCLWCLPANLL